VDQTEYAERRDDAGDSDAFDYVRVQLPTGGHGDNIAKSQLTANQVNRVDLQTKRLAPLTRHNTETQNYYKPNSITLSDTNQLRTSSEPASVMEFGFIYAGTQKYNNNYKSISESLRLKARTDYLANTTSGGNEFHVSRTRLIKKCYVPLDTI